MFQKFPEFITDDTRYHDPDDPTTNSKEAPRGQLITFEKSEEKHKFLLPKKICENNSVLDLGSCLSASGAWVLEHGAMFYTGVEIDDYNHKLYDIRGVDVRLTFRSKEDFFRKKIARTITGLSGRDATNNDRFLRDSVIVSVHTRNIGGESF